MKNALLEQTQSSEIILETAKDFFCLCDTEGKILKVNRAAFASLGYTPEELIGMNVRDLEAEGWSGKTTRHIKKVMETGSGSFETKHRHKDGRLVDFEVSINSVKMGEETFVFSFLRDITERKKQEQALKAREKELQSRNRTLKEMNTALRVLLKAREEDRRELEDKVTANIQKLVSPYVQRLRNASCDARQKAYLDILEANLNDIVSPFSRTLSSEYMKLSPTEVKISNLIKHGHTTKDIADLLNLSIKTVETHRRNIRRKIGICNKKENLRTHLSHIMSDDRPAEGEPTN